MGQMGSFLFCLHLCLSAEKEGTHLPLPCPRSYLKQRRGQGPVLRGETPSTALITKISQEGETSPGAALERHLNVHAPKTYLQKRYGRFISLPHL